MNFSNLTVRTRLAIGFGASLLLLVAVATLGIVSIEKSNDALHQIVDINGKKAEQVEKMSESIHIVTRVMRTVALLKAEDAINSQKKKIVTARDVYDTALATLQKLPLSEKGQTLLARVVDESVAGRKADNDFMEMVKTDRDGAVALLMNSSIPLVAKWQDSLKEFDELQKKYDKEDADAAYAANERAIEFAVLFSVGALIVSLLAGFLITRSIRKQLGGEPAQATAVAMQIAEGDLTATIDLTSDDDSSMMYAISKMRDNLTGIVQEVRSGTDAIATASGQIASGNLDLSSRTEQQAASLEETASSMEELTSTVKQNADNSRQANQLAESASEVAVKGGMVVAQVVDTMSAINDSAKKIVDIIGVIDGIAFQTNILALNAAVEAARAGEQGRGFAVVATEVRNLAQRSAAAAKEIKTLIGDSVAKVDAGSKLVGDAGATMEEIVASVKRVSDIINEITAASQEQSSGIEQINQAVAQMDEVTQQNAALVEEAAAAAGSLQEQADNLVQTVKVFKTGAGTKASVSVLKPRTAPALVSKPAPAQVSAAKSAPRLTQRRASSNRVAAAEIPAMVGGDWESF